MSIMVKFMSIIGKFEKQNRVTFWELLKSIIGKKRSIIDSGLLTRLFCGAEASRDLNTIFESACERKINACDLARIGLRNILVCACMYRTAPLLRPPLLRPTFRKKRGGGGGNNEDLHFRLTVKPPPPPPPPPSTNSHTLYSTEGWKSCWPRTCCKT